MVIMKNRNETNERRCIFLAEVYVLLQKKKKMVDAKSKTRSRYLGVESGQKCTGHEIRRLGRQKEASVKNLTFLTRSHSQLDKFFFIFCKSSSEKIQLVIHLVTVILQFKSLFFSFTHFAIH